VSAFWTTLLSIAAGAAGYLIATFWFQPVLRYRDVKSQIASDLVFFANAVELQKTDGTMRSDALERKDTNRRRAADLIAIYAQLPVWYRVWLARRPEDPREASQELIGLSNASGRDDAKQYVTNVQRALRLPALR
jgi:hypothetical protein